MAIVDADGKIANSIASLDQTSGTFDPASSPATGGYQLIKGDADRKSLMAEKEELLRQIKSTLAYPAESSAVASRVSQRVEQFRDKIREIDKKLAKNDADDGWKIHKTFGRFTIYRGTGRYEGKFIVKGEGTNTTVDSYDRAYDLVQQLLKY